MPLHPISSPLDLHRFARSQVPEPNAPVGATHASSWSPEIHQAIVETLNEVGPKGQPLLHRLTAAATRLHAVTTHEPGGAAEWAAMNSVRAAVGQALNILPPHFDASAKLRELRTQLQQRSMELIPGCMTAPIPDHLHFVWIGGLGEIQHEYIKTWRDLNPGHDLTIWYDPQATLSLELSRLINPRRDRGAPAPDAEAVRRIIETQNRAHEFITQRLGGPRPQSFDDAALAFMDSHLHLTPRQLAGMQERRTQNLKSYDEAVERLRTSGTGAVRLERIDALFRTAADGAAPARDLHASYLRELGQRGNLAAASDIVRILALHETGGVYLDADLLPTWQAEFDHRFKQLCNDLRDEGVLRPTTLDALQANDAASLIYVQCEMVLDELGGRFPQRLQRQADGSYTSYAAKLPAVAQTRLREFVRQWANEQKQRGCDALGAFFTSLPPMKTAPGLVRHDGFRGSVSNAVLAAQAGAGGLLDILAVMNRNYNLLRFLDEAEGEPGALRPHMFDFGRYMLNCELAVLLPDEGNTCSMFEGYRSEFASGQWTSTSIVSGPMATTVPSLGLFHNAKIDDTLRSLALACANHFTEEGALSSWFVRQRSETPSSSSSSAATRPSQAEAAAV
jgi:hypothetical protein